MPILGSSWGTLYIASLCMLYSPLMHTHSMQFLLHTLELIHTYYTILFTLTLCCTEFIISYTMYSTTTQATTTAHYIHYFLCTTSLIPHSTTLCYNPYIKQTLVPLASVYMRSRECECSEEKLPATIVSSNLRRLPDPKEVCRVTSTVVFWSAPLIHISNHLWLVYTNTSPLMDFGLPTLALPIATWCVDTYLSLDPAKVPCI